MSIFRKINKKTETEEASKQAVAKKPKTNTYNEPYKYHAQFKAAEASAQIECKGLWSECADLDVREYQTAWKY